MIRGWDDLFALVDDHTNNINSMKMSPYFKVFEKDIVYKYLVTGPLLIIKIKVSSFLVITVLIKNFRFKNDFINIFNIIKYIFIKL